MSPGPTAATITVRETLALLDAPFAATASAVAQDRYALWLGSGISFGRVDGLSELVPRVLEFLRVRIVHGDSECRFCKALNDALALALLAPDEQAGIDLTRPVSEWAICETVVTRLAANYSRFLSIMVDGEVDDFLLWDGVDVVRTYADASLEPDTEHLCIAVLVLEGVASEIATANWDPLIERAVVTLSGSVNPIIRAQSKSLVGADALPES